MDAKVEIKKKGEVEKLKTALRALEEPDRLEVLDDALVNQDIFPFLCPFIFVKTDTENDVQTIMDRIRITATISPDGSTINVGEDFDITVTVRNCTGNYLRNPSLSARSTTFASVNAPSTRVLSDMAPNQSRTETFTCTANAVTPAGAPADTLVNLTVQSNLDLNGFKTQAVQSEISPD